MDISNFITCDIENITEVDPDSLKKLEQLIFNEMDGDEQKFINIASIISNFYGNVGSEFFSKWNRS